MNEGSALPWARPFQVGLRTIHILAMALVLGGVALGAGHDRLKTSIVATVLSGALLFALDLAKGTTVIHHASGVAVLVKLALLGVGNLLPQQRLGWYLAATAVASIGSHMPGSWRHFSLIHGNVVRR